jgi:hypothetical protein
MEFGVSIAAFMPFAKAATYTPPGNGASPLAVSVILDKAVERWSVGTMGASIVTSRDEMTFRRSQVLPTRGATVSIGGDVYTVTEVVEDDDILITVAVIKDKAQPLPIPDPEPDPE